MPSPPCQQGEAFYRLVTGYSGGGTTNSLPPQESGTGHSHCKHSNTATRVDTGTYAVSGTDDEMAQLHRGEGRVKIWG